MVKLLDKNDRIVKGENMKTKNMLKLNQSFTKQTEFSIIQTVQNQWEEAFETNASQTQIDFEGHHVSSLAINDLKTSGRSLNPPAPGGLLSLAI